MVDIWKVVNNDAKSKGMKFEQPTFYSNAMGFYHAVNWKERWIQGILLFHLFMLALFILTRKHHNFQSVLLVAICILVYFAETFNAYGAEHWQSFSTQDYFDKNGVFVSVIFSAPLVTIGFSITLHTIYQSSQLLIKVKRKELGVDKKTLQKGSGNETEAKGQEKPKTE